MSEENTRYIDVSMTWEVSVHELLNLLPHLTREGVEDARRHIIHAAKMADLYVQMMEGEAVEVRVAEATTSRLEMAVRSDPDPRIIEGGE